MPIFLSKCYAPVFEVEPILRALDCAMKILLDEIEGEIQSPRTRTRHSSSYNPLIDFPVAKHYGRDKETRFILKFYFDDNDRNDFRKSINSTINNELSIEVSITRSGFEKLDRELRWT